MLALKREDSAGGSAPGGFLLAGYKRNSQIRWHGEHPGRTIASNEECIADVGANSQVIEGATFQLIVSNPCFKAITTASVRALAFNLRSMEVI